MKTNESPNHSYLRYHHWRTMQGVNDSIGKSSPPEKPFIDFMTQYKYDTEMAKTSRLHLSKLKEQLNKAESSQKMIQKLQDNLGLLGDKKNPLAINNWLPKQKSNEYQVNDNPKKTNFDNLLNEYFPNEIAKKTEIEHTERENISKKNIFVSAIELQTSREKKKQSPIFKLYEQLEKNKKDTLCNFNVKEFNPKSNNRLINVDKRKYPSPKLRGKLPFHVSQDVIIEKSIMEHSSNVDNM